MTVKSDTTPVAVNPNFTTDFEVRRQPESWNLLFAYTVAEDLLAGETHDYKFLGAGRDDTGKEVHVFRMSPMPDEAATAVSNPPDKLAAVRELLEQLVAAHRMGTTPPSKGQVHSMAYDALQLLKS